MKYLKYFENKIDPFGEEDWNEKDNELNKYRVTVYEAARGEVIVYAKNEGEAQEQAIEEYENGNIDWGRLDVDYDIKKIEDK